MYQVLSHVFVNSFVRGVAKTTGTLITMFVGWQMFKITNGHDDLLSFIISKRPEKRRLIKLRIPVNKSTDEEYDSHEEINLEDMEDMEHMEKKIKSLFDKL
jgi:hypothetical protein